MRGNETHITVHHYIEHSSFWYALIMACCVALIMIVILVLLIIIGLVIYAVIRARNSKKHHQSLDRPPPGRSCHQRASRDSVDFRGPSSCDVASTTASRVLPGLRGVVPDPGPEVNSSALSVPMPAVRADDRTANSSVSSLGLYDVLFPDKHDGEVVLKPPSDLASSAGRMFVSTRKNSRAASNAEPGATCGAASGSLEWDYLQPSLYSESPISTVESEGDLQQIVNVCWV